MQAADDYELATGKKLLAIWNTAADESVCPICEPLEGEPEEYHGSINFRLGRQAIRTAVASLSLCRWNRQF